MIGDVLFSIFAAIGFIIITFAAWSENLALNIVLIIGTVGMIIFFINNLHLYFWKKNLDKAIKELKLSEESVKKIESEIDNDN